MDIQEAYQVMQEASGIKVGDRAKVLRTFKTYEMGCNVLWFKDKANFVGQTFPVTKVCRHYIELDTGNLNCVQFPFFVLEIVEPAKNIEVRFMCDGEDVTEKISDETKRNLLENLE